MRGLRWIDSFLASLSRYTSPTFLESLIQREIGKETGRLAAKKEEELLYPMVRNHHFKDIVEILTKVFNASLLFNCEFQL